ncbi:MAG TPA: alginate export family protein [Hyphomonadaceae bacterium]|nr:alginate export family protein [Hyphomonadaceae bacterium]
MRRQPALFIGLVLVAAEAAPSAFAQTPATEAPKERPWTLGDALGAPDWLKISGSVRPRYETLTNTLTADRAGGDEMLSIQSLLKVEAVAADFVLGGELLDARRLSGNAGGSVPAEIDALEPVQLYAAWRPKDFLIPGANLDLTVGRFTMNVGSRRLVARANYRNIVQSFDGVRAVWANDDWFKLTAFYTHPTLRQPADTPSALDNEAALNRSHDNYRFSGASFEASLPLSLTAELFHYDLDENDAPGNATRNRDLATTGARLFRAPTKGAWDIDLEYIKQTGTIRATANAADIADLDHDATMMHVQIGYTLDAPWSPRLAFQYDQASGDKSPADLSNERFDSLFGDRSFEYGPTGLYGAIARTNLIGPSIRIEVKPDRLSEAVVAVRQIRLDSATDSFANSNVRDPSGASSDDVGTQIELRYRRWLVPDSLRLQVGGAAILKGEFLDTAPNATRNGDTLFGYTDLTWTF